MKRAKLRILEIVFVWMLLQERDIAEKLVKSFLLKKGFDERMISPYDSVFVRFGTTTGRADYVCFYVRGEDRLPFLVVEVKRPGEDMDSVQAESYAQRLGAPFFAVTDGQHWHWYLTREGQSNSVRITDCPVPISAGIEPVLSGDKIGKSQSIIQFVQLYEDKLNKDEKNCPEVEKCYFTEKPHPECNSCLIWNLIWINEATKKLSKILLKVDKISGEALAKTLSDPFIFWARQPALSLIERYARQNVERTRKSLRFLCNEKIPIEERFDSLTAEGKLHVPGFGPFIVSVLLAGLDKEKYCMISERNITGLKRLGLVDVQPSSITGRDYDNLNRIMIHLSRNFKDEFGYGRLTLVHDFTLLIDRYLESGIWRG